MTLDYYPFYKEREYVDWQNGVVGDMNGDGYDDYYFGTDTPGHVFLARTLYRHGRAAFPITTAVVQIVYGDANGGTDASLRTTSSRWVVIRSLIAWAPRASAWSRFSMRTD